MPSPLKRLKNLVCQHNSVGESLCCRFWMSKRYTINSISHKLGIRLLIPSCLIKCQKYLVLVRRRRSPWWQEADPFIARTVLSRRLLICQIGRFGRLWSLSQRMPKTGSSPKLICKTNRKSQILGWKMKTEYYF